MRLTANKIAGILREHGYKLTPQRHAVLKVIAASNDHLTPEAIRMADFDINLEEGKIVIPTFTWNSVLSIDYPY